MALVRCLSGHVSRMIPGLLAVRGFSIATLSCGSPRPWSSSAVPGSEALSLEDASDDGPDYESEDEELEEEYYPEGEVLVSLRYLRRDNRTEFVSDHRESALRGSRAAHITCRD